MAKEISSNKRHKTSKTGVFYRISKTNGKQDKTYYIVYKDADNKTVESKVGKDSQGVGINYAYQKYVESVQSIKFGEAVPIKRKRRKIFTFDDAFKVYISHAKTDKKSWKKDEELYNNHLFNFSNLELVSLTQMEFNKLRVEREKTHSKRTVQYILAVARQIINYAINNDLIQNYTNPLSGGKVKVKNIDNSNTAYFTHEQANLLLKVLEKYKSSSSYIYQFTVLLLHTGARFSEVASLTWNDIDFKENTIYFKSTKDGNARYISISNLAKEVLKSLSTNKNLLLPTQNGTQVKQMNKKWQTIVDGLFPNNTITIKRTDNEGHLISLSSNDRAILNKEKKNRLTVHSLRHTHASWMAISGNFNLMEIRDELGHKNTTMTERYAHLLPKDRHVKTNNMFNSLD